MSVDVMYQPYMHSPYFGTSYERAVSTSSDPFKVSKLTSFRNLSLKFYPEVYIPVASQVCVNSIQLEFLNLALRLKRHFMSKEWHNLRFSNSAPDFGFARKRGNQEPRIQHWYLTNHYNGIVIISSLTLS